MLDETQLPLLHFSRLQLLLNHTKHESVNSLWPTNVLWGRQTSKAAIFLLPLTNYWSVAELLLFLSFFLCWAALFLLFIITPLISGQLWEKSKREMQIWIMEIRGTQREGRVGVQQIEQAAGGASGQRQQDWYLLLKANWEPDLQLSETFIVLSDV